MMSDEMIDAFTEVLNAAGAKVCESCGSRALVCTDNDDAAASGSADGGRTAAAAARWFCFSCGHESVESCAFQD